MKNRSIILWSLSILVLSAVNIYIVKDMGNKLDISLNRLDSIEAGIRFIQSNSSTTYTVQNSANDKKADEVLTPSELANYLKIDMEKVYDMIDHPDAKLPYVNINGEYRFSKSAIDEWLKSNNNINAVD